MTVQSDPVPILLVDDNRDNLLALEAALNDLGHRLVMADAGHAALRCLLQEDFALILMDVAMPDLDGYQVAELIRARGRSRDTPIIFLTANHTSPAQVFKGYAVGAVDYLSKPFPVPLLISKVTVFVELYRRSRTLREQAVALQRAQQELEHRVAERTAELAQANAALSVEIGVRRRVEAEREALLEREQAARRRAETLNRTKDEFLATLSHELRTPLNAIVGWAHILNACETDPDLRARAVQVIQNNAAVQRQLINDILEVSAIISGKMRLQVTQIDATRVVQAALDTVRPAADAKGIAVQASLAPVGWMAGDGDRLQQVAWNLLSNAVKFTPRGGTVRVQLTRTSDDVELIVEDTGQGISPDFLPHVFDRFTQADSSTSREHGGLGLGMAIVRHLVELHGGTVDAHSEGPGRGAVFTVRLPVVVARNGPAAYAERPMTTVHAEVPASMPSLTGVVVMVVDDERDARDLMLQALHQCGATVHLASSAAEGFVLLQRERPHIVLSDVGMPGEDGRAFMRRVRALPPEHGGATPAIAVSAYVGASEERESAAVGYQAHLGKPVDLSALVRIMASLVQPPRAAP
jgi:signal transduction histidine kinase